LSCGGVFARWIEGDSGANLMIDFVLFDSIADLAVVGFLNRFAPFDEMFNGDATGECDLPEEDDPMGINVNLV